MDEVKRHEDTFLNETYHDKVDIPEFDIEDTSDTHVLRTRRLVDVYESCNSVIEPESYMDASKHSEWIDAMKDELEMIKKNNTWKLVDLPKGKNAIGVKWIYKIKFQPDGSIYKHKARLVVKGYSQVAGVDFGDTFAPVARHDTINELVEEIYEEFNNDHLVKEFKKQMESEFDMSDMGLVSYFLGMEIKQLPNGVHICQRKYASDMLKKFKMFLCKPVTSPLVYKCKLSKDDGKKFANPNRFRSIVGSLLYLTISRPDLAFAASFLSRFMGEPSSSHLGAAKRVLRYVKGSLDLEIMFERNKVVKLEGYADSDWAESIDDSKSTSGYIFTLGSGVHLLELKKQACCSRFESNSSWSMQSSGVNSSFVKEYLQSRMSNTSDKGTTFGDGAARVGMQLRSSPKRDINRLIATFIGKPVMLDSYTSSMCNDSWGRSSFSRCLIKVNSEADLVDVVTIVKTGPSVKHNVRYEPKATTSAPKKGTTYVGYTSQSTPMLKTSGNSSKKDNLSMSNSFFALNEEEEDEEEDVENVYDESANLIQNTKAGGSSSFTAAAG
ncbi:retrovirus-related pol polyprotein from transposon TNT 1-94 [Tanacetum coccineum]